MELDGKPQQCFWVMLGGCLVPSRRPAPFFRLPEAWVFDTGSQRGADGQETQSEARAKLERVYLGVESFRNLRPARAGFEGVTVEIQTAVVTHVTSDEVPGGSSSHGASHKGGYDSTSVIVAAAPRQHLHPRGVAHEARIMTSTRQGTHNDASRYTSSYPEWAAGTRPSAYYTVSERGSLSPQRADSFLILVQHQ